MKTKVQSRPFSTYMILEEEGTLFLNHDVENHEFFFYGFFSSQPRHNPSTSGISITCII